MESPNFNELLKSRWAAIFQSPEARDIFRNGFDHLKMRQIEGGYIVYHNESLIKNKRMSQVDFSQVEEVKDSDVQDDVFQDFDENKFNFNQCTPPEILFYVNLDEETVIPKEVNDKWEEEHLFDEQQLENEISETENHPVVINVSPVCPNHCILPLFPQEELPQTIGQDIIMLLLQVFKISGSNDLRVGYNSLGAFTSVNHLHFQLVYASDIFSHTKKFPIEDCPRKELLRTSLQNPQEKINIYSVGVIIEELIHYPVRGFVLKPMEEKAELGDIYSSLSFVAGTITNYLLEKAIPHNLIFADVGLTIYIIPRQHEENHKTKSLRCAWMEIAGLALCQDDESYKTLTKKVFEEVLAKEVSLPENEFNNIKDQVLNIFKSTYE